MILSLLQVLLHRQFEAEKSSGKFVRQRKLRITRPGLAWQFCCNFPGRNDLKVVMQIQHSGVQSCAAWELTVSTAISDKISAALMDLSAPV